MEQLLLINHISKSEVFDYKNSYLCNKDLYTSNHGVYNSNRTTKYWNYHNKNGELTRLEYVHLKYNNKEFTTIHKINIIKFSSDIIDSDDLIKEEIIFINRSNEKYNMINKLILSIEKEIGSHTFKFSDEIGWNIRNFLKITMNMYNGSIILNYKNKHITLNEDKLKLFIQKNKKLILKAKEIVDKKQIEEIEERQQETQETQKTQETKKSIEEKQIEKRNSLKKFSLMFSIKKTLKERYSIQSCKPFPEKYEWE